MRALLALGANLGDRRENLLRALALLRHAGVEVLRAGAVVETAAVGGDPDKPYLNQVVEVETALDPWRLLDLCKRVEAAIGRDPGAPRMAPRPIDVDILTCRGVTISSSRLTVPHPRWAGRSFLREPLATLPAEGAWWETPGEGP